MTSVEFGIDRLLAEPELRKPLEVPAARFPIFSFRARAHIRNI
ncbi:MAG TPA: hypothetical protein VJ597_05600 [Sphingomicrobium sp.]|nr:hypothetical protein [Sphingomicrobium sp.]